MSPRIEKHFSVADLMALVSCSDEHIQKARRNGRLVHAFYLGRSPRFAESEVARWLSEGCPADRAAA